MGFVNLVLVVWRVEDYLGRFCVRHSRIEMPSSLLNSRSSRLRQVKPARFAAWLIGMLVSRSNRFNVVMRLLVIALRIVVPAFSLKRRSARRREHPRCRMTSGTPMPLVAFRLM